MTISEAAERFGMTHDTLRYYERIGLIPPVPRDKSGRRDYDEESCSWISLMKCLRSAGVQIEALVEYVRLCRTGGDTVEARRAILIDQREKLQARIEDMQASLALLDKKIEYYDVKSFVIDK